MRALGGGPACACLGRASVIASLCLLLALAACGRTVPFAAADGTVPPGGIASIERWAIDGVPEEMWIRGADIANPIIVILHGGPGTSESALFRHYLPQLERRFTVVYWDQPGTGRSYNTAARERGLSMQRIVDDLDRVIDRLRRRFYTPGVVLLGHSWGSAVGMLYAQQHPDKVLAYVGTGQEASVPEGERLSYRFAVDQAHARGRARAVSELEAIGEPPHTVSEMLASRRWVERFGGTFGNSALSTGALIWAALQEPTSTLLDLYRFGAGNRFSLNALWPEFSQIDLTRRVPQVAAPVFFLLGRDDQVTPSALAARYFEALRAPCKQLVWFDGGGHNVPFEQPEPFVNALEQRVRPVALDGCRSLAAG